MSAALLTTVLVALSASAPRAALDVGPGLRFATLGAALEEAEAGDTIRVRPGLYRERIEVRVPVALVGEGLPELRGPGEGNVVRILADDVELRGFTISGSGSDMMFSDAGVRVEGARARIVRNQLQDNLFGIHLHSCEGARLEDNEIRGRGALAIGSRGPGIHLYDSRGARILRNRVSDVRDGIYFDHSDDHHVEGNDFTRLRYAIHYMFCKDNRFVANAMHDSVGGAAIMYTSRVHFERNHLYRNRDGFNAFGLLLKDCEDSVAIGNAIVGNVTGLFVEGSHRNRFEGNLIAHNDVAVMLYGSSLDNRFSANDFVANRAVLHRVGRAHARWSIDGVGNYYDGYRGYDLDGDGRGDLPFGLQDPFEYLEGDFPLLRLLLHSPAAEALAAAEASFPIIPHGDEEDLAPALRPFGRAGAGPAADGAQADPWLALGAGVLACCSGWASWRLRR